MAGPFIKRVLLRLIERAVTSWRLAHLQKYQQSFNAINIPKPKGISKHVITVILPCKLFYRLNCLENADFDNIPWFLVTSSDSFLSWEELLLAESRIIQQCHGDIYQRHPAVLAKKQRLVSLCYGLLITVISCLIWRLTALFLLGCNSLFL